MARFSAVLASYRPARFDVVTGAARPADGIAGPPTGEPPAPVSPPVPLFYLVEITHRQLHSIQ
jgi:hypothetical protein